MFTFSTRQRRATAVTLLVIFLNVLIGQLVCAAVGSPVIQLSARAAAHHQHEHGTAGHHQHGDHDHSSGGHHHEKASHDPHKTTSCCQDDAAAVWASLHVPPKVAFEKAISPLVLSMPPALDWAPSRFQAWDVMQSVRLVSPQHLPPKIPDVRVFLHSLTI